jgi:hypothetical protein
MPTVLIDRDEAHEAAQRELAKPVYATEGVRDRILDWFNDFLYRLQADGSEVAGGWWWFIVTVVLTLVAVAVVVAVRIALRTMRTNRKGEFHLFGTTELSATEHRATAERFAAEGDWAAAIRHRVRAIARQLEEDGVLNAIPGRTATELARDAGQSIPELVSELRFAAGAFNDVTYGEEPGLESSYRNIVILDEHIRSRRLPSTRETAAHEDSWAHLH